MCHLPIDIIYYEKNFIPTFAQQENLDESLDSKVYIIYNSENTCCLNIIHFITL